METLRFPVGGIRPVIAGAVSTPLLALVAAWASPAHGAASFMAFEAVPNAVGFPPECDGRKSPVPYITAQYLNGDPIHLDGKLDDPAWNNAQGATGFLVWDPNRGEIPTEETVFKVAYDRDAVYFAVACHEKDPSKISSRLSRRDRFGDSDLVSVYIDPYHDKTTGYNFKVNPEGVQIDSYVYNDGEQDQDWDAVWQAETFQDERGWYVEMRIPFSAIRYRPGSDMTWGLQVYRYMHGRGEDTSWVTWDRETRGFVSRFGELRGLRDVPPPRQLELLPYFVTEATDPAQAGTESGMDRLQKVGADLKYGVSADLTLNATLQPDFGQVEADPAVLNLSPFETFFVEKRPFFIEGSKFFEQRYFNLFYSRRIGTGDENSRIRVAGKLTGKTSSGISVGALAATTDIAEEGKAHNPFVKGTEPAHFFLGRVGKEFEDGRYRVNLMGTASYHTGSRDAYEDPYDVDSDRGSREAYTGGLDFDLNFKNREYNVSGSVIGSELHPEAITVDSTLVPQAKSYGTGGHVELRKQGGAVRAGLFGHWESDALDINDLGFLSAPDEMLTGGWVGYLYNPEGKSRLFNRAEIFYNLTLSWLYGGRTGRDVVTNDVVWSYDGGHVQRPNTNVNGFGQWKNYWATWFGIEYIPEGTQRYETRGGPLMSEPTTIGGWLGGETDYRKSLSFSTEWSHYRDTEENHQTNGFLGMRWNQSSALNHEIRLSGSVRRDDTQYLETVDLRERPGGQGIGGLSYVFGKIHQETLDLTLRTNILFSRKTSLEIYAQPFISVGDYLEGRELAVPDSYVLIPYGENAGYRVQDNDFSYTSLNLNVVYRWEYRPGSTIYVVWTQGREGYTEMRDRPQGGFNNSIGTGAVFSSEPENKFLIKVSYWLPV